MNNKIIGVIGAGTMGSGIAQSAAQNGFVTYLFDSNEKILQTAYNNTILSLKRLEEKGKITKEEHTAIISRLHIASSIQMFSKCDLIIEAIIENIDSKKSILSQLEQNIVSEQCILASNTSSLSITSLGSFCERPERFVGIHFFNPATIMPLVEVIPGLETSKETIQESKQWITDLGKIPVVAKDTPGFIVNRIARPFYSESIRIYEEGIANFSDIDFAFTAKAGFKMGPFELMDFIGNDINYTVTETVWKQFFYDPRYKPSFTQKRLVEAGRLGRKSGKGYYNYSEREKNSKSNLTDELLHTIVNRILILLMNEAADAVFMNIASIQDIDTAMVKGTNYPKGLLAWADEYGINRIVREIDLLYDRYREDRYRVCPLLRDMAQKGSTFYMP